MVQPHLEQPEEVGRLNGQVMENLLRVGFNAHSSLLPWPQARPARREEVGGENGLPPAWRTRVAQRRQPRPQALAAVSRLAARSRPSKVAPSRPLPPSGRASQG